MSESAAPATASPAPQEQILGILFGVVHSRCLSAAVELGVADALSDGPLPIDAIALKTGAHAENLFRLMRALETLGIFQQVSPGVFQNSPISDCLRKDTPGSVFSMVRIQAPGWAYWDGYSQMLPTLRSGKTALFETWGYDLWEHYRRQPEQWTVFNDAMRSMNYPATPAVTAAYDWSRFPVIADIGGGIGSQLVDILEANPACRGIVVDQQEVIAEAIPHPRMETAAGNFFEHIPVQADAYLFRNIIHDWNDKDAIAILKTLRKTIKPDARVALIEWLIPDTPGFHFGKWTDIIMMTGVGGKERTKNEFEKLFHESGFQLEEIVPTASHFTIVVGRPTT